MFCGGAKLNPEEKLRLWIAVASTLAGCITGFLLGLAASYF